jgi:hypothetical protein
LGADFRSIRLAECRAVGRAWPTEIAIKGRKTGRESYLNYLGVGSLQRDGSERIVAGLLAFGEIPD